MIQFSIVFQPHKKPFIKNLNRKKIGNIAILLQSILLGGNSLKSIETPQKMEDSNVPKPQLCSQTSTLFPNLNFVPKPQLWRFAWPEANMGRPGLLGWWLVVGNHRAVRWVKIKNLKQDHFAKGKAGGNRNRFQSKTGWQHQQNCILRDFFRIARLFFFVFSMWSVISYNQGLRNLFENSIALVFRGPWHAIAMPQKSPKNTPAGSWDTILPNHPMIS